MPTVILEPLPEEIAAFVERRRALGQDAYEEVWDGVYHMTSAPSGEHAALQHIQSVVLGAIARSLGPVPRPSRSSPSRYLERGHSAVLDVDMRVLADDIEWPPDDGWRGRGSERAPQAT